MTMTSRVGVVAAALALLAALFVIALQPAEAGSFSEHVSGNFIDTSLDLAGDDGMAANYVSGATTGRNGATYEGLWEVQFTDPTGACADGEVEGVVVAYSVVRRYGNGDLQHSELVDGSLCFNPATGLSTLTINAEITGGPGRYSTASGTYPAAYTVQSHVPDPMGGIAHGSFYGTTTGTS